MAILLPLRLLTLPTLAFLAIGSAGQATESPTARLPRLNRVFGTLGDSELRGAGTLWFWSITGITPIEDWHWNERRGHSLGAVLSYMSDGRLRTRVNTAWGGTTSRDWATDGTITTPGLFTVNSPNADKGRVLRWKPKLVLVSLGMNDSSNLRGLECTVEDHQRYVNSVLDSVQATGATPFVLLSPPRDDEIAAQPRTLDTLTVGQALGQMVESDKATCVARGIPFFVTRDVLGPRAEPSTWLGKYRLDGVHWHRPQALKDLAKQIMVRPEMAELMSTPVRIARVAHGNGVESGNLIKFACFQGGLLPGSIRPRGWALGGDLGETTCTVGLNSAPVGTDLLGNVLVLSRRGRSPKPKVVSQDIDGGFKPGDELRFSGLFRATGFGDRSWFDPTDSANGRCAYSLVLRFADASGKDMGQPYAVAACDSWSIDTNGEFWRFGMDFVVPPGAATIRVQVANENPAGPRGARATLEVGNLSLRYLGPSGNGVVYP